MPGFTTILVMVGALTAAGMFGLLVVRLETIRRLPFFAALITGLLVWFLVRSIPDGAATLAAQILRLVAPHLTGPLEIKQLEVGFAVQVAEFTAAAMVLFAYGFGMRHGRGLLDAQTSRVIRIRFVAVAAAAFGWSVWAPHSLPHPAVGVGSALPLSSAALGAALGILAHRNQLVGRAEVTILLWFAGLVAVGTALGQLVTPGLLLILAAAAALLGLVYLVGQLIELTSRDLREAHQGGMLPATIVGFVVGVALGR